MGRRRPLATCPEGNSMAHYKGEPATGRGGGAETEGRATGGHGAKYGEAVFGVRGTRTTKPERPTKEDTFVDREEEGSRSPLPLCTSYLCAMVVIYLECLTNTGDCFFYG
jgi:hypothetical protein